MKNTLLKFQAAALILTLSFSCTERIDIQLEEDYARLAVESYIIPESDSGFVRLTQTAGYFSNTPAERISNATVTIEVKDRVYYLNENPTDKGYYLTPPDFYVETYDSLNLVIDLENEIDGEKHFEANTFVPLISDEIDSISAFLEPDFDSWIIKLYAVDPPGPNYYMFNVMRNDTMVTDSISKVFVTDDRLVDDMYIMGAWVTFVPEYEFKPGDTVTLITSSITKEYYDFIIELQTEIGYKDPLFSGPPANVSTNLTNGAVGYFSAYPSAYTQYVIPLDYSE